MSYDVHPRFQRPEPEPSVWRLKWREVLALPLLIPGIIIFGIGFVIICAGIWVAGDDELLDDVFSGP